jgi:carbon monoxide dehydrogenase subunit G
MKLENTFEVPVPVADAWPVLLDVARVAPLLPGAVVDEVDGDVVVGRVKVKLGPVALTYRGTITLVEKDDAAHRAVMRAAAREARGNGNVGATITTALTDLGDTTSVTVSTDLEVTGKPAQFGRGMIEDVSAHLTAQFAQSLATGLADGSLGGPAGTSDAAGTPEAPEASEVPRLTASVPAGSSAGPRSPSPAGPAQEPEPLDLLRLVGPSGLSSEARSTAVAFVMGLLLGLLLGGRRR